MENGRYEMNVLVSLGEELTYSRSGGFMGGKFYHQ